MPFRSAVKWSPVEIGYLQSHMKDPKDQLCIALGKTRSALDKKLKELKGLSSPNEIPVSFQSRVGKREDIGIFVRSGWEANFYRICRIAGSGFSNPEYEPKLFDFAGKVPSKGQALSYTPDFRVTWNNRTHYLEVKGGWLRPHDKTKLKRFKKFYPEEFATLIALVPSENSPTTTFFRELGISESHFVFYNNLKKQYAKTIPNWEK